MHPVTEHEPQIGVDSGRVFARDFARTRIDVERNVAKLRAVRAERLERQTKRVLQVRIATGHCSEPGDDAVASPDLRIAGLQRGRAETSRRNTAAQDAQCLLAGSAQQVAFVWWRLGGIASEWRRNPCLSYR